MLIEMIQKIVDRFSGKISDITTTILYLFIGIRMVISLGNIFSLINNPIIEKTNTTLHALMILICLFTFYISLTSTYYKVPSRRIVQYFILVLGISIFSLNYLAENFNGVFLNILNNIKNIDVIPKEMLIGNIRVVTLIIPSTIIIPACFLSLEVLKDKNSKSKLREYEVDILLPTVHEMNDTTIDIEICKDSKTGMPCMVPEKTLYEHLWIQGGTGSGKSALFITPTLEQLLRKKSYLTYQLKKIAFECLENGIASITYPVSNKWFNENFDMELIEPVKGKEKEFYKAFEKYTIGVIKQDDVVYELSFSEDENIQLPCLKSNDYKYTVNIDVIKNGMLYDNKFFEITKENELMSLDLDVIRVETQIAATYEENAKVKMNSTESIDTDYKDGEIEASKIKVEYNANEDQPDLIIDLKPLNTQYSFIVKVILKGSGRLVPRNLGTTVVAPDSELVNITCDIAKQYNIKVHKIDPFMGEIQKGTIAKFNPLRGDSPEKIGDIVASILVNMDIGSSSKVNPYFTNAGVRAVRNLVILLKVTYPSLFNREPTLVDVLACLNDFDLVSKPVEYIMKNYNLLNRWKSVVDYFNTRFLENPKDHEGKGAASVVGSLKKETQKAIEGIINQLDNLLSREEIRHILCSDEDSIDLRDVLRKGECIAISTRQGNLGARLGRAFALFFILSIQNEVLSRYSENENPEIPHFLFIDEFPMYCNESTETFFSFARKYKCSVTIAIQNMGQLKKVSDEFGETIFTNTTTKILLPNSNLEDRKYWSDYFGSTEEMDIMTGITTSSLFAENPSYNESMRGSIVEKRNITEYDVNNLNFKQLFYSYSNKKGRKSIGKGVADFLKTDEKPYMNEMFNFEPYCIKEEEYNKRLKTEQAKKEKQEKQVIEKQLSSNSSIEKELFEEDKTEHSKVEQESTKTTTKSDETMLNNDEETKEVEEANTKIIEEKKEDTKAREPKSTNNLIDQMFIVEE